MLLFPSLLFLVVSLAADDVIASPAQKPLTIEPLSECSLTPSIIIPLTSAKGPRELHGRFLHVTDIHPDPHYVDKASESTACHRKKAKKKKNKSLYYGTPYSCVIQRGLVHASCLYLTSSCRECDSPFSLTNFTLDFLKENWGDEIDFVICTL